MNLLMILPLVMGQQTTTLAKLDPLETLCAAGIESIEVPQTEEEIVRIDIDVFQRGRTGLYGRPNEFFGLNCFPGIDFVTKYRVPESYLSVAVNLPGHPMLQSPNGCATQSHQSLEATADFLFSGRCHNPTFQWVVVSSFDEPTMSWVDEADINPEDQFQTISITDPAMLELFQGTGTVTMPVSQGFIYDLQWAGCVSPYSVRLWHQFRIDITIFTAAG